jgi:hypothetical protein
MDLGSLFLILALLVLVIWYISRPFFTPQPARSNPSDRQDEQKRSSLLAERDRILNALQELDFDFALGKIPEDDYPYQRKVLLQKGADVLRAMDSIESDLPAETDAEAQIEAAIASRRAEVGERSQVKIRTVPNNGFPQGVDPDDELEVMLANRRRSRSEKAAGFCPQCGSPLQKSDHFCPNCGFKIL